MSRGVSGGGWHGLVRPCWCGVALHLAAQQLLVWVEPQVLGVCAVSRMRHLCLDSEYGWAVAREKHKRRLKKKRKETFTGVSESTLEFLKSRVSFNIYAIAHRYLPTGFKYFVVHLNICDY